jgi:hypothetical protein
MEHFIKRSDRSRPNIVLAPAPNNKENIIELYCHPQTLQQVIDDNLNAKLGEYCGLIHGNVLELGDEGGTNGLLEATALFRGLKRPMELPGLDGKIYVYITNPQCSYLYPIEKKYEGIGVTPTTKPKDSVFATYVDITNDFEKYGINKEKIRGNIQGIVLFWEWVLNSKENQNFPENCDSRYVQKVW